MKNMIMINDKDGGKAWIREENISVCGFSTCDLPDCRDSVHYRITTNTWGISVIREELIRVMMILEVDFNDEDIPINVVREVQQVPGRVAFADFANYMNRKDN